MQITPEMREQAERVIRATTEKYTAGSCPKGEWSVDELLWYARRCIDVLKIECGGLYGVASEVRAEMGVDEFNGILAQAQLAAMKTLDEGKDPCAFDQ